LRKLIFIFGILIIGTSCSVTRKGITKTSVISEITENSDIINLIENQNVTNRKFFIQKAEIEFLKEGESQSFIASVKYDVHGSYLISLRGKSGLEAARIYITKDTILVNDRINRQLLSGKSDYTERKFGIPLALLPVIFGDLVSGNNKPDKELRCEESTINLERSVKGVNMRCIIDCDKGKLISVSREGSVNSGMSELKFGKFIRWEEGFMPSEIQINYMDSQLLIKILKFEIPWEGNIEFVPGNNYEQIELL